MEKAGLLHSRWEDPDTAGEQGRPRPRLYRVTAVGQRTFEDAEIASHASSCWCDDCRFKTRGFIGVIRDERS